MSVRLDAGPRLNAEVPQAGAGRTSLAIVVAGYLGVLTASELVGLAFGAPIAAMIDAAVLVAALAHATTADRTTRQLLTAFSLIALIRVISVGAVVPGIPESAFYLMTAVPLILGCWILLLDQDRIVPATWLRARRPRLDLTLAVAGLGAGVAGHLLLPPSARPIAGGPVELAVLAAGLALTALVEELIFRGLLLSGLAAAFRSGALAVATSAGVHAAMHLGTGAPGLVLVILGLGLVLGWAVLRGASIWGVAAFHAGFLVSAAMFWPIVLGGSSRIT